MKLYLSCIIGSIALISLAPQAFSVKPQNTYGAKEMAPFLSRSSNNSIKPSSLSKKRSFVSPFLFQEAFPRNFSASSSRTPEPISFSPSISPGSCSGGTVFIFKMPSLDGKVPAISLARQEPLSLGGTSEIHVHSDLNYMEVELKD